MKNQEVNKVNPAIVGYEFVKDCTHTGGYERCDCDLLFAVVRGHSDDLSSIMEVCKYTRENYRKLSERWPFDKGYFILHGAVVGNEIRYYMS